MNRKKVRYVLLAGLLALLTVAAWLARSQQMASACPLPSDPEIGTLPEDGLEPKVGYGKNATGEFRVFNKEGGTLLNFALSKTGSGTWLSYDPTEGSSLGSWENQQVVIHLSYATQSLPVGTYTNTISISGNAINSPVDFPITLEVMPFVYRSGPAMCADFVH